MALILNLFSHVHAFGTCGTRVLCTYEIPADVS